jgi:hypothetical protein
MNNPHQGYAQQGYSPNPYAAPADAQHGGAESGCDACGRVGPSKLVTFRQNVGVLVMRFPKTITGHLCRFCIDSYFWRFTLVSWFFGWWGVISFFTTLVAIPANIFTYLGSLGLPSPPDDRESLTTKRGRGTIMVVFGVFWGFFALLWLAVSVGMMVAPNKPDDVGAGAVNLVLALVFLVAPSAALVGFGIRGRSRAAAG